MEKADRLGDLDFGRLGDRLFATYRPPPGFAAGNKRKK